MPEITSVETIRAKLREFESRVDGAIATANALARIKTDAEKLVGHIAGIEKKSEKTDTKLQKSLEKAEIVRRQLDQLHGEWGTLKQQLAAAQDESRTIGARLDAQLDSAIQTLVRRVAAAEEGLKTANKISLAEQADLLGQLAASTQANAKVAEKAQVFVADTGARLDGLLATLQDDLQTSIQGSFTQSEKWLESEIHRIEADLRQAQETLRHAAGHKAENYQQLLREEMIAFKADIQSNLLQQEQAIDRRLTDFLAKQNVMVQNLSQQIDSFNRAAQAQSADLGVSNAKLSELAGMFFSHREKSEKELLMLNSRVSELQSLFAKTETTLGVQNERISALGQAAQETARRLEKTLDRLRQIRFIGGNFK